MSGPNEGNLTSHTKLALDFFDDVLDSIIVDVASECHRVARLGLDHNVDQQEEEMRLSNEARVMVADPSYVSDANTKYDVDIYGQTHPSTATEVLYCMNCGQKTTAGKFAPHLEKCMGKGREAARPKVTRSSTARRSRGNIAYGSNSNTNRLSNPGLPGSAANHLSNNAFEA